MTNTTTLVNRYAQGNLLLILRDLYKAQLANDHVTIAKLELKFDTLSKAV